MTTYSHQKCRDAGEHICQELSGRVCIEPGCDQPAGTLWGPLWCPEHDQERLDRISRQMAEIGDAMSRSTALAAGNGSEERCV